MGKAVYFVGAGLSKALESEADTPVPLLMDFVKVAAHYAATDESNIIILALTGLERLGRFRWRSPEALKLARAFDPNRPDPVVIAALVAAFRRRPAESIEDLLARDDRGASFGEAAVFDAPIRFRYAVNRVFRRIGWSVNLELLKRYLIFRLAQAGEHTFVSFNYDLFLDRAVSEVSTDWRWHCGYGYEVGYSTSVDPSDGDDDVVAAPAHACDSGVRVLKPHGSLNWLLPFANPGKTMPFEDGPTVVRVDDDGHPEYVGTLPDWVKVILPDAGLPHHVEPGIIAPLKRKDANLLIFKHIRSEELTAVRDADDAYVLGWSMPLSDDDQTCLIRYAVSLRNAPLQRVVAVNRNQPPEYFERVADVFGVPLERVEVWNDGFADYVDAVVAAG